MSVSALNTKVSKRELVAFSLPNVFIGVSTTAMVAVLPAFYAKYTAATLAAIAAGVFFARILEVVIDPLVGYLSDATRSPWGARKPWLFAGTLLAALGIYFLFNPSPESGGFYFTFWSIVFFMAWTIINIPYRAWGVELTRDYDERSKIFTSLGIAYGMGAILFAAAPFLPIFDVAEMSPDTLGTIGLILVICFPLAGLIAVSTTRQGVTTRSDHQTFLALLSAIRTNRPFWFFLAAFALGGIAQGMVLACFLFFTGTYLGLERHFPLTLLLVYLGGLAGMLIWLRLVYTFGKTRVWAIAWIGAAVIGLSLAFIPRNGEGLVALLVLSSLYGFMSAIDTFAPYSVLGDVIDYDQMRTNVNRAGNYNAIVAFVQKANIAIGSSAAFLLLDLFNYDVSGETNSAGAELGFLFTFVAVPAVLYLSAVLVIWNFPLNRRRHDIIRRRLEQKQARQVAV